jgi:hypothetical protein
MKEALHLVGYDHDGSPVKQLLQEMRSFPRLTRQGLTTLPRRKFVQSGKRSQPFPEGNRETDD